MNRISTKLLAGLAILLFIAVLPIVVFATNEDVSIVSTINNEAKQEYTIYIKGISTQNFKYAFTNLENADPNGIDLSYINSNPDLGGNQAAVLDAATYEKLSGESSKIYMWAKVKDQNGNDDFILENIQLDLSKALAEESLEQIETLTSRIEVEIADSEEDTTTVRNETIDGVEEVANVGYVKILEDEDATYYYERTKLPSSEEHNKLKTLAEQAQTEYNEMDMYEKIQFATELNEIFTIVTNNANWQEVEDMIIKQDEESKKGDEYIVLLKKVSKTERNNVTTLDVQFLTAEENYKPNIIIEEVVTQETTKLPITYDSIALFVALGIVVVLIVAVFFRMKKLSKNNEEK